MWRPVCDPYGPLISHVISTHRRTGLRYTKRSIISWVVVIPKEGWARVAAPALLLVWHRLFRFYFWKKKFSKFCWIFFFFFFLNFDKFWIFFSEFVCDECGACYATRKGLRYHMLSRHIGEKNIPCPHCDLKFFRKDRLDAHLKGKHKIGVKTYTCPTCYKVVYNKSKLQRHLLTHSDFKPYKCTVCTASYKDNVNYKIHMKNIHGVDIKNPYRIVDSEKKNWEKNCSYITLKYGQVIGMHSLY